MKIHTICLHNSASAKATTTLEVVRDWHVNGNGWQDIGYHKVIQTGGLVRQGRPDHIMGAGTLGHNEGILQVLICGNFHDAIYKNGKLMVPEEFPEMEQIEAVIWVCTTLCVRHELPATAIKCHRDFNQTACPGKNFYPFMPYIVARVAKNLAKMRAS